MRHLVNHLGRLVLIGIAAGLCGSDTRPIGADETISGRDAYRQKCARCHGAEGEGVSGEFESALSGPRSVEELTRLIERTMPEDSPGDCTGIEAAHVAKYIYDTFYSPAARQRRGLDPPARTDRMRLTIPQYRSSIADLIGHFTPSPKAFALPQGHTGESTAKKDSPPTDDSNSNTENSPHAKGVPGLVGSYYRSKGMSKADELAITRIDRRMEFDFENRAPLEGMPDDQFAIVWDGALQADRTGEYQFRVHTPNGVRLYLNLDPGRRIRKLRDDSDAAGQVPLIDAWVGSGTMREQSARLFLLGGRRYPFRLEFFKYQDPTASLKLEWKPPHGAWTVLDHHHVSTDQVSRTFVVDIPFPADDRSLGYERGTSVSHEWFTAAASGAIAAADEVVSRLPLLAGPLGNHAHEEGRDDEDDSNVAASDEDASAERRRLQDFVVKFARHAFRRPLTFAEVSRLRDIPFSAEGQADAAVRRAVTWILSSPEFLFVDLSSPDVSPDPHTIAARLSLIMWDSLPDAKLMAAAAAGRLTDREEIARQACRMLNDLRTKHKLRTFFEHWLEIEDRDLVKDRDLYPTFDEGLIADLRRSLDIFLDEIAWSDSSDYRQLLSANHLWLNGRLSDFYLPSSQESKQPAGEAESGFRRIDFPATERAGVLTHPYVLSAFSYHNNTSPIHRGVFLARNIVGRALRPPPMAIAFKSEDFPPELTMREKITQLTRDANCMSCHSVINPMGFTLEHFDAVGRWRSVENNRPIDAKSRYTTELGETIEVDEVRDIAELALGSAAAHRAFVVQLFQHLTKQEPAAYGPAVLQQLCAEFAADQFHIQNLMVRIAVIAALHGMETVSVVESDGSRPTTSSPK